MNDNEKYIKNFVKDIPFDTPDNEHRDALKKHLLNSFPKLQLHSQNPASNITRIIMKSPISKIAAAAIIVLACIIALTMLNKTSGVALANVLTQVEKINAYMLKTSVETTQMVNNSQVSQKSQTTLLVSKEYGFKIITEIPDSNSNNYVTEQETYGLIQKNTIITITPAQKCYTKEQMDSNYIEIFKNQFYDPPTMVKKILECNHKNIGRSTIDGIDVEGFQTTDPNFQSGRQYQTAFEIDVKLWANIKTQLPVRIEMNFKNNGININCVLNEFKWNVAVRESDFEPNIPLDYKNISSGGEMPSVTEETGELEAALPK